MKKPTLNLRQINLSNFNKLIIGLFLTMNISYSEEGVLTGDPKLACEAILCLQAQGMAVPECYPSLTKFNSIYGAEVYTTIARRVEFLLKCPVDPGIVMDLKKKGFIGGGTVDDLPCDVDVLNNTTMQQQFRRCDILDYDDLSKSQQLEIKSKINGFDKKTVGGKVYSCSSPIHVRNFSMSISGGGYYKNCTEFQGTYSCDTGVKYKIPDKCANIKKDTDGNFYELKREEKDGIINIKKIKTHLENDDEV